MTDDQSGPIYTDRIPGEKLYEELLADDESRLPIPHPKLRVAKARAGDAGGHGECLDWLVRADFQDEAAVKRQLKAWVAGIPARVGARVGLSTNRIYNYQPSGSARNPTKTGSSKSPQRCSFPR